VLKDSPAMKDFGFRRMCRLINAFGKVRRGTLQEIYFKRNTFEAGICMKINKSMTKCPETIGHLCIRFGHFRLTDTNFSGTRGEFTVKRRQCRACGLRSRIGRAERENPVRNVETPATGVRQALRQSRSEVVSLVESAQGQQTGVTADLPTTKINPHLTMRVERKGLW